MRKIEMFLCLLIFFSCNTGRVNIETKPPEEICITRINNSTYDDVTIAYGSANEIGEIILLLKKGVNEKCIDVIKEGFCYRVDIQKLNTTNDFLDISYRLGEYDIFEDGELIFPLDVPIYKIVNIENDCSVIRPND